MKANFRRFFSLTLIIVSFFASFFVTQKYLNQRLLESKKTLGAQTQNDGQTFPVRLLIPKINVNVVIESVGVTSKGNMATPKNTDNAGWFSLGPRPGETGSAVIAGHFDNIDGNPSIFANLSQLTAGDKLYIQDNRGEFKTFTVSSSKLFNPGYANSVFAPSDKAYLNLVTCEGVWDPDTKSYSKRLVVFSDLAT
ncbi:MAG TPA: class F sortase [Patescibacteria group bacterium]|nr:class F sortase [Patescibacteria group bacterium]